MKYQKIVEGIFIERPNRFIAKVIIDGKEETVHVKNTGRCRELLPKGAKVYLADEEGKERKTRYDLIAALKDNRVINMDSGAPNVVVKEALQQGLILRGVKEIKPEYTYIAELKKSYKTCHIHDQYKCIIYNCIDKH